MKGCMGKEEKTDETGKNYERKGEKGRDGWGGGMVD